MKIIHLTIFLFFFLLSLSAFSQSVATRTVKIEASPTKTLATIEVHNFQGKGLKSLKAMLILKDAGGKVVDVQSRWLFGDTPDAATPAILANNSKTEVSIPLTPPKPFTQLEIIATRIILDDDTIVTPRPMPPSTLPAEAPPN